MLLVAQPHPLSHLDSCLSLKSQVIPDLNRLLPPLPSAVRTKLSSTLCGIVALASAWSPCFCPRPPAVSSPPSYQNEPVKVKLDPSLRIFQQLLVSLRKSRFSSKDQQGLRSGLISSCAALHSSPSLPRRLPVSSQNLGVSGSRLPRGCRTYGSVCWETYFSRYRCMAHPLAFFRS